jgi:hypothetical protein
MVKRDPLKTKMLWTDFDGLGIQNRPLNLEPLGFQGSDGNVGCLVSEMSPETGRLQFKSGFEPPARKETENSKMTRNSCDGA